MKKEFKDVQVGDILVCYDEYKHDYEEHRINVTSIEKDEEGVKAFGVDLEYVNENGEFEEGDDEYISCVHEGNFVRFESEVK